MKPWEFYRFTLSEFYEYYAQQMKRIDEEFEKNDMFIARIECILAEINRDKKKKIKPFKVEDFMITKQKKKQTVDEMAIVCKAIALAFGGEING